MLVILTHISIKLRHGLQVQMTDNGTIELVGDSQSTERPSVQFCGSLISSEMPNSGTNRGSLKFDFDSRSDDGLEYASNQLIDDVLNNEMREPTQISNNMSRSQGVSQTAPRVDSFAGSVYS